MQDNIWPYKYKDSTHIKNTEYKDSTQLINTKYKDSTHLTNTECKDDSQELSSPNANKTAKYKVEIFCHCVEKLVVAALKV